MTLYKSMTLSISLTVSMSLTMSMIVSIFMTVSMSMTVSVTLLYGPIDFFLFRTMLIEKALQKKIVLAELLI